MVANNLHQRMVFFERAAPLGPLDGIFREISSDSIIRKAVTTSEAHLKLLDPRFFIVPGVRRWVPKSLAARILAYARRRFPEAAKAAAAFRSAASVVLWVTIRTDSRTWLGQTEGLLNVIDGLATEHPCLAVIFDGFSLPEGAAADRNAETIAAETAVVSEILQGLPPDVAVKSLVGAPLLEAIAWSEAADFYIAHHGTLQHKIGWLANAPGIVHAGDNLERHIERHAAFTAREAGVPPVYVFGKAARDDTRDPGGTCSATRWTGGRFSPPPCPASRPPQVRATNVRERARTADRGRPAAIRWTGPASTDYATHRPVDKQSRPPNPARRMKPRPPARFSSHAWQGSCL
jgi:hypothetical protein